MKVFAIIVCYGPDLAHLREMRSVVLQSNAALILVDNTEGSYLEESGQFDDCILVINRDNVGIACAQNIGIRRAIDSGADIVVFFDQDSRIDSKFLPSLLAPLKTGRPAVVAPVCYDREKGFEFPSLRLGRYASYEKVYKEGRTEPYDVDAVMSSGTAATVETFERVGVMDEDLFIDFVDTEWCLRCRQQNVSIQVVPAAVMAHSVGSRSIDFWLTTVLVHSPIRCYYQIRNCFLLYGKDSVPLRLAVRHSLVMALHKSLLLMRVPNRIRYLTAYAEGVFDGLRRRTGKKSHGR